MSSFAHVLSGEGSGMASFKKFDGNPPLSLPHPTRSRAVPHPLPVSVDPAPETGRLRKKRKTVRVHS